MFRTGKVYAIMGPNASGKTTLLLTLTGLLKPRKGSVRIFGKIVKSLKDVVGIVSFVPQNPDLILMFETVKNELMERARRRNLSFCLLYTSPSPRD